MVCVWVVALLVVPLAVGSNPPLAVIFHGIGLDFIGLKDWINNINIRWKQLRLILCTLEIQDRINPTSVKLC